MKNGIATTIALNLHRIAVEQDFQETLLDGEKCGHCGRELLTQYSLRTHCCGACSQKGLNGRPTTNNRAERKRARAEKHGWDYDFNKGYGEKFFRAFDKAYTLKPTIESQSSSTEPKGIEQGEGIERKMSLSRTTSKLLGTHGMGTAEGSQLRSSRSVLVVAEVGKHLPNNATSCTNISGIMEECTGSNPDGSIPARSALQDFGEQTNFSGHDTTQSPLFAGQKHAGIFLRYVTNFQSRVFPPACPSYVHLLR